MALSPRTRLRIVLCGAAAVIALSAGWMILRSSSLVQIERVQIFGVEGDQAREIRDELTVAAKEMTTLRIREDELRATVRDYPVVSSLRTERDLPHGIRIYVNAYAPVASLEVGGQRMAVAADGTLLRGTATNDLPRVRVARMDDGKRVRDKETMRAVRLLAAAPRLLRSRVDRVFRGPRGLSTTLRKGPKLYFGGGADFAAKWSAAARVLADSSSLGASYIDVRLPTRPSAGGLAALPEDPAPEVAEIDPSLQLEPQLER